MKYIWEESDLNNDSNWGLLVEKGDEIAIVGGKRVTSLRDGHSWDYDDYADMTVKFNAYGWKPVTAPINASVLIKAAKKVSFNYGAGFENR